jgi:hypothetical protein
VEFHFGLIAFIIQDIDTGQQIKLNITLDQEVLDELDIEDIQYWKFVDESWVDLSDLLESEDGDNIFELTLTDGGQGDADGTANGEITDPGGIGFVLDSGGGGNGGDNTYRLVLLEEDSQSDGIIDLLQQVKALALTDDDSVNEVKFRWLDPTLTIVRTNTALANSSGAAFDTFNPDKPGAWIVEADFGQGEIVRKTVNVQFLVIPESGIGIIAVVGSALATLGVYYRLRGRIQT